MIAKAKDWSRASAPIGTIRVRKRPVGSDGRAVRGFRMIKVRMDGPKQGRWMNYARWWWLKNKGPIGEGLRVIHVDGDTMNDAPENLTLGTADEVAFYFHERDPEGSRRNYAKAAQATAECNRLRGRVRRAAGYLACRWYPVDLAAKVIHNRPVKKRRHVWRAVGFEVPETANGAGVDATAMGFPGYSLTQACILKVLCENDHPEGLRGSDLRALVAVERAARGEPLVGRGAICSEMVCLTKYKLISIRRGGRRESVYRMSDRVRDLRRPFSTVVPVRGRELTAEASGRFAGFTRVDPDLAPRRRVLPAEALQLLAAAAAGGGA